MNRERQEVCGIAPKPLLEEQDKNSDSQNSSLIMTISTPSIHAEEHPTTPKTPPSSTTPSFKRHKPKDKHGQQQQRPFVVREKEKPRYEACGLGLRGEEKEQEYQHTPVFYPKDPASVFCSQAFQDCRTQSGHYPLGRPARQVKLNALSHSKYSPDIKGLRGVLFVQTPGMIHLPGWTREEHLMDSCPTLHRIEFSCKSRTEQAVEVTSSSSSSDTSSTSSAEETASSSLILEHSMRIPGDFYVHDWQRWNGPPAATEPVLHWRRAELTPLSKFSHRTADRLRLFMTGVLRLLSGGTKGNQILHPEGAAIGPWLTGPFLLGPLHGQTGRLLSVQEGSPWTLECDRLHLGAKQVFMWTELCPEFKGVLIGRPQIDDESIATFVLMEEPERKLASHPCTYRLCSIQSKGEAKVEAKWLAPWSSMILTWTMLSKDLALVPIQAAKKLTNRQFGNQMQGYTGGASSDHEECLFFVVRKGYGLVAIYRTESCFITGIVSYRKDMEGSTPAFVANCYENDYLYRGGGLGLDALTNPRHDLPSGELRLFHLPNLEIEAARFDGAAGQLERFPLVEFTVIRDTCLEMMTRAKYLTTGVEEQAPRFVYGLTFNNDHDNSARVWWNALCRADLEKALDDMIWSEPGFFITAPPTIVAIDKDKDSAVIAILIVLDCSQVKPSQLVILEAQTGSTEWKEQGWFELPLTIPAAYTNTIWLPPSPIKQTMNFLNKKDPSEETKTLQ